MGSEVHITPSRLGRFNIRLEYDRTRWSFELLWHYYRPIMTKSFLNRSSWTSSANERVRERNSKNVTATNDVSENLTLRQIDLSQNPIVGCCMFSRVFPSSFYEKSDQTSFYVESEHSRYSYCAFHLIWFSLMEEATYTCISNSEHDIKIYA